MTTSAVPRGRTPGGGGAVSKGRTGGEAGLHPRLPPLQDGQGLARWGASRGPRREASPREARRPPSPACSGPPTAGDRTGCCPGKCPRLLCRVAGGRTARLMSKLLGVLPTSAHIFSGAFCCCPTSPSGARSRHVSAEEARGGGVSPAALVSTPPRAQAREERVTVGRGCHVHAHQDREQSAHLFPGAVETPHPSTGSPGSGSPPPASSVQEGRGASSCQRAT